MQARWLSSGKLAVALVASVVFWLIAWYWDTAASMAAIWWQSDTFAHGMVVYPISIWLIWRQRIFLASLPIEPAFFALIPFALASLGWLLGDLGSVHAARQLSLIAMVACAAWTVLGTRIARAIAFPLAFTFLAAPVGDFLTPVLVERTADFTVGALRLTGIPVYREGNNFVVPSGSWSVVYECSGLRYLIASVTLGLLYAYLTYRSFKRRLIFVLASIWFPVMANWLRAYMIVMIGHLSGMKYATGVDHLIYGWVFFGLVMLLLFWIGSFWREDIAPERPDAAGLLPAGRQVLSRGTLASAVLVSAIATAAPGYVEHLDAGGPIAAIQLRPLSEVNGWSTDTGADTDFLPRYRGARATSKQTYSRDGQRVGVFIGYYSRQGEGAQLISSQNALVTNEDRSWNQLSQRRIADERLGFDVLRSVLRSGDGDLVVWHWYWVGGRFTSHAELAKFWQAFDKLRGRGDDAAVLMIYARSGKGNGHAEAALAAFANDMVPEISTALTQTRARTVLARGEGR